MSQHISLHNWLQMCLNSPRTMQAEEPGRAAFMCNAFVPFYWLRSFALAIQDGAPIFDG